MASSPPWWAPVGNSSVLISNTEPDKITITGTATATDVMCALFTGPFAPGGHLVTAAVTGGWTTTQMATALKNAINADAVLSAVSIAATSALGVVTLSIPAAQEPTTVSSYALPATQTATITGSVAQGDVLTLTVTNATLTGSPVTVSFTAPLSATTTTLAAGLAAAVNANAALIAAGITATSAVNVLTFAFPQNIGAITFSQSVSTGSETITLSGNATETLTYSQAAATETVTFSPSNGKLSGGTGPVFATNNFQYSYGGNVQAFFYGKGYVLGYQIVQSLVAQGMPIV
jgi:hypothetical protein